MASHYAIPKRLISEEERSLLRGKLINHAISIPLETSSYAFKRRYLVDVLRVLGCSESDFSVHTTDHEEVELLFPRLRRDREAADGGTTEVDSESLTSRGVLKGGSWNGRNRSAFFEVAEEVLLPYLGGNICISVPHHHHHSPEENDDFHIFIWSSPDTDIDHDVRTPERLFGIEVDCRDPSYGPSSDSEVIIDDDGNPVAEVINGNNLYIFHDVCEHGTDREVQIFRKILEKVIDLIGGTPEEIAARKAEYEIRRRERMREQFVTFCLSRNERRAKEYKEKISEINSEIIDLQKELTVKMRARHEHMQMIEAFGEASDQSREEYLAEFEKLGGMIHVKKVKVKNDDLIISTDTLYAMVEIEEKMRRYELGEYDIIINTAYGSVKFINTTRKIHGHWGEFDNHPHVDKHGNACLGNISSILPQLIATAKYTVVYTICLQYLTNGVNPSDPAGAHIVKYPQVDFEETTDDTESEESATEPTEATPATDVVNEDVEGEEETERPPAAAAAG